MGSLRDLSQVLCMSGQAPHFAEQIARVPFRRIVWLLPLALGLHELEEWNIHAWENQFFDNPPVASVNATRIVLLIISAVGLAWTILAC